MLTGLVPLEICERKVVPGSSPGFREFLLSLVFCGLSKPPPLAAFVFMWCSPCMRLPPNSPVLEECQSYWVNTYRYDLIITQLITSASQVVLVVKKSACKCSRHQRCRFNSWIGKIPWSRKWQPTPVFLPGKFTERSLAGYSPWGHKESDTTEHAPSYICQDPTSR